MQHDDGENRQNAQYIYINNPIALPNTLHILPPKMNMRLSICFTAAMLVVQIQLLTNGGYAFAFYETPALIIIEVLNGTDNIQVQQ